MSETRATPFHARTAVLNRHNRWHNRNGWTFASDYGDAHFEALAARNSAIMADISWRWRIEIEGAKAAELLSRLMTKDVSRLEPGNSMKGLWLSDQGGVRGAGVVARFGRDAFVLAASTPDIEWIGLAASQFDVAVRDVSGEEGGIALIGPYAGAVLKAAGLEANLDALAFRKVFWRGLDVTVTRWGEQNGYEIWCRNDDALTVWDRIAKSGVDYALVPAGLTATDILDLERGVMRPGRDYQAAQLGSDAHPTSLSLGLEQLIDESHSRFNGRAAWLASRASEKMRFVGVEIDSETPPAKFSSMIHEERPVGRVTAAVFSPALRKAIALAQIDVAASGPGTLLKIALPPDEHGDEQAIGRIVELPFLPPPAAI
ncbi:MAG TPA: glycine cleavage T C-terminal barrel domain-containing protein [Rhizomicrobium sp.]|jgi:aminomethyltransferase|nr:glycine cleavage T C-terminal barrel domain-containing protein [Rhizomicrobium sp.]